jgi:hypothetical protein
LQANTWYHPQYSDFLSFRFRSSKITTARRL